MSMLDSAMAALGLGGAGDQAAQAGQAGAAGQAGQAGLLKGLMSVVNSPSVGGLGGLLQKLQSAGLADKVSSWIGKGPNQPLQPAEVEKALGPEQVQQIANEAGVDRTQAASGLASMLPQLVDKLSPDGKLPDLGSLTQILGQSAKQ